MVRKKEVSPRGHAKKEGPKWKGVTISLTAEEGQWLDRVAKELQDAGLPMNRSRVAREGILMLREALEGKSPSEAVGYFMRRQRKRRR